MKNAGTKLIYSGNYFVGIPAALLLAIGTTVLALTLCIDPFRFDPVTTLRGFWQLYSPHILFKTGL